MISFINQSHIKFKLLSLGVHIGHSSLINTFNNRINNQFMHGCRKGYYIINLSCTLFFLRKALFFFYNSHKQMSTSLVFFSSLGSSSKLDFSVRLFFRNNMNISNEFSFVYLKWRNGLISNYSYCFAKFIKFILQKSTLFLKHLNVSKKLKNSFFLTLFTKMMFVTTQLSLSKNKDFTDTSFFYEFKKIRHLWKVVLFMRFWNSFLIIPDMMLSANPDPSNSPLKEFSSLKLPVISLFDTNSDMLPYSYPIPSNDDSLLVFFFFYYLFLNVVKKSRL